jgi:glycosyltransferase involved in cell wall biosynthesis
MKSYAFIVNAVIPGPRAHGLYVVRSVEAATNLGYQSHLIIPKRKSDEPLPDSNPIKFYNLTTPIKITYLYYISFPFTALGHRLSTTIFALYACFLSWKKKIAIIQTTDPEVILMLWLFKAWYRPKIIFDVQLKPPTWLSWFARVIDVAVSDAPGFTQMLTKKSLGKHIIQLPMGYRENDYRNYKSKPSPSCVIGYIGRFSTFKTEKGVNYLLNLLFEHKLPQKTKVLAVGGPKNVADHYREQINRRNELTSRVNIIDQVKPDQVARFLSQIDIAWLVYPPNPHFISFMSPMKAIEYAISNIPIIASDFPSIRTIFNDEEVYYVDPNNEKQILATIKHIIKNPDEAKQKATKAYQKVKPFTWKNRQQMIFSKLQNC